MSAMPPPTLLSGQSAELALLEAGFTLVEARSTHRMYRRHHFRVVIPFPTKDRRLHPKVMVQLRKALKAT